MRCATRCVVVWLLATSPARTAHETEAQRQECMRAVYKYLQDRYLAGYDDYVRAVQVRNAQGIDEQPMAPWQGATCPPTLAHVGPALFTRAWGPETNTVAWLWGPEWGKRQGASHPFGIRP